MINWPILSDSSPEAAHKKYCEIAGWLFGEFFHEGNKPWATPELVELSRKPWMTPEIVELFI